MPRIGLTQQRVIEAATELIEQGGVEFFSMRALAEKLNVKTASLYNHVESMDILLADVCAHALKMQRDALMHSVVLERGRRRSERWQTPIACLQRRIASSIA